MSPWKCTTRAFVALAWLGAAPLVCGGQVRETVSVPAQGTPTTLDVANWNVEWFGDPRHGPTDEELQLDHVSAVMAGADVDLWGLEEIVSAARFAALVARLPGYAGILANDPVVRGGAASYSDFGNAEQKVALVYRKDEVTVLGARVILARDDYDFAGRPPVEFRLSVTLNHATEKLVVIVMHAKSGRDRKSWTRRAAAARALKSYLDATWPTQRVLVIGDFNDEIDGSITSGRPSPYRVFVADPADYTFTTTQLVRDHVASMVRYPTVIDQQLATDEELADYVPGSVEVLRADRYIPDYAGTTSDHYPVIARYRVVGPSR
jgi:endonuclease/exonuclease/phosphatase family metal-dependent hydrolase